MMQRARKTSSHLKHAVSCKKTWLKPSTRYSITKSDSDLQPQNFGKVCSSKEIEYISKE